MIVSRDYEYEPPPLGLQPAICIGYCDLGFQRGYADKPQRKVVLLFELEARKSDGSHFVTSKKYTATLGEKANLLKDLQSWRGMGFTPEELKGFDLNKIKGKPCQLNMVSITKGNGDQSVVVDSVLPAPRGWKPFELETAPDYIPEWVSEAIENQLPAPASRHQAPAHDDDEVVF